jgi:nitrate/nitrite transporter NarK
MSAIFGVTEASAVAAFSAICGWAAMTLPPNKEDRDFIKMYNPKSLLRSNWIRILPFLETVLLTVTLFYFAQNTHADSWNIIAGIVLFFFHLLLIKSRNMTFWDLTYLQSLVNNTVSENQFKYEIRSTLNTGIVLGWILHLGTVAGFYVCLIHENMQGLFLVPTLVFTGYVVLFFVHSIAMTQVIMKWMKKELPLPRDDERFVSGNGFRGVREYTRRRFVRY